MPKIDWIGKGVVVNHHREVAYRLVHCDKGFSAGDAAAGNLLVQGDNLEALRALLPYYAGRVKCIYIDPPYNTGNEGWVYNDRVNSPEIREWLGKVVGGEADDLCRHSKWLCMMYPRLRLLRDFLREDGVIFISIDDNEQHHLRMLMDEIFGANNFYAMINWTARVKPMNAGVAKYKFQKSEEYILVYGKISMQKHEPFNVKENAPKKYPCTDKEGNVYREAEVQQRKNIGIKRSDRMVFPIAGVSPHAGYRWTIGEDNARMLVKEKRIFIREGKVYRIFYKHEEDNFAYQPLWANFGESCGSSESGKADLDDIAPGHGFETVKPVDLLTKLIFHFSDKDSIVMDSFAGSGTTAHAVLQQNKADGGNRKFVLVEMDKNISENITAKRIAKAIKGYKNGDKTVAPLGGGFHFCTLGTSLFDENGNIGGKVKFADLAAHIFFSETGTPIAKRAKTPLLGVCDNRAIYLLFNGVMGDNNALTIAALHSLPPPPQNGMTRVIYAESTLLSKERLAREKIEFRQIPYKIRLR